MAGALDDMKQLLGEFVDQPNWSETDNETLAGLCGWKRAEGKRRRWVSMWGETQAKPPNFVEDTDEALTLIPPDYTSIAIVLEPSGGWRVEIKKFHFDAASIVGRHCSPAMALCVAALKAHICSTSTAPEDGAATSSWSYVPTPHQVVCYDRQTERIAATIDVPAHAFPAVARIAGIPPDDPAGVIIYCLTAEQADAAVRLVGAKIETGRRYFLEPA